MKWSIHLVNHRTKVYIVVSTEEGGSQNVGHKVSYSSG